MPNAAQVATYNFIRSEIARLRGPQSHVPLSLAQVTPLTDEGSYAAFRVNGAGVLVKPSGKVDDAGLPECPTYANGLLSGRFLPASRRTCLAEATHTSHPCIVRNTLRSRSSLTCSTVLCSTKANRPLSGTTLNQFKAKCRCTMRVPTNRRRTSIRTISCFSSSPRKSTASCLGGCQPSIKTGCSKRAAALLT